MRIVVTIHVVKNGYLVSYTGRKMAQQLADLNPELERFIPTQRTGNMMVPVEESLIITDENELIALLKQLRNTIQQ